ncbi:MAG: PDZ domain-containing protein [Actinobacteria bacterium]|nr:PDZ domain-containing protein [Actinomycetota bacterium]
MIRRIAYALSLLLVVLAASIVPMPVVEFSPGGATSIPGELLEVDDSLDTTPISGDLSLLTVRLGHPSLVEVLRAVASPLRDLQDRRAVFPQGVRDQEYLDLQQEEFRRTFELAVAVGLEAAGVAGSVASAPVVAQVLPDGPAAGKLRAGDVLLAIDGEEVGSRAELIDRSLGLEAGQTVVLTVERDGEEVDVAVEAGLVPGLDRPGFGIALADVLEDVELPEGIDMRSTRIGGPSAGMMVALTTYDLFSDEDLAAGREIAGTGTIDADGVVGPVGGVEGKVVAAVAAGVDVLLVPAEHAEEATGQPHGELRIVPVATLDEAIAALRDG